MIGFSEARKEHLGTPFCFIGLGKQSVPADFRLGEISTCKSYSCIMLAYRNDGSGVGPEI